MMFSIENFLELIIALLDIFMYFFLSELNSSIAFIIFLERSSIFEFSHNHPVFLSIIISFGPVSQSKEITGNPLLCASNMTNTKPSNLELNI